MSFANPQSTLLRREAFAIGRRQTAETVERSIRTPQGMSRRASLKALSSGFGYLAFSALAHSESGASKIRIPKSEIRNLTPHHAPKAKRVIFLCMKGAPSHVDLFDYKPELNKRDGKTAEGKYLTGATLLGAQAPFQQRGQSGLWISDLFPHLSKHADDLCLIRSMHTDLPNHPQAFAQMHTGSFQFVRPSLGAWSLYGLGSENENLPGFITLNPPADMGGATNYGSAFLPAQCQGTKIGGGMVPALFAALTGKTEEPGPPLKNIRNDFLSRDSQRTQIDLIKALDSKKLAADVFNPEVEGAIASLELGYRMQDEIPHVLDLKSEPKHILELYGIGANQANANSGVAPTGSADRFAKQCLLARRLAEAGVRFIEVTAPVGWDHHRNLKNSLTDACGVTDRPIAALLTDLKQRGMLDDTLVIWSGEFGRTPYAQSGDGRDHNNKGYTTWMAGGGVKGGHSHGATDELGYKALENPVHIHDWHATILHLLGLDHRALTFNYAGRDFRLTDTAGNVVTDIIA